MALLHINVVARRQLQRERQFRVRTDPFEILDEHVFYNRFRLSKTAVMDLSRLLHDDLRRKRRSNTLTVPEQLLVALRFYARRQKQGGQKHSLSNTAARHYCTGKLLFFSETALFFSNTLNTCK
jgi:hypothetical protein